MDLRIGSVLDSALYVDNLPESVDFYQRVLSLRPSS